MRYSIFVRYWRGREKWEYNEMVLICNFSTTDEIFCLNQILEEK
jgi:hypothetical protein